MPAPVLTPAPPAPQRVNSPATFTNDAELFVAWQENFPDEMNALATYLDGLVGGTLDPTLAAIAALAASSDKLPYFTGVDAASLADLTTLGRALIASATTSDGRAVLELGNSATRDIGTSTGDVAAGDDARILGATQSSDLADTGGASLVGFLQSGTGATARTAQAKFRDVLYLADFGAAGDGVADDTAEIQAAINEAIASGKVLYAGPGTYKITDTITVPDEITFIGAGDNKTIFNMVSASVKPAFTLSCADNWSVINLMMSGFVIICNGGAAVCDGISLTTTATNSAISHLRLENIRILNPRRGVAGLGVIYKSIFNLITIGGTVTEHGFYFDAGFIDIVYNTFSNLEVTGVGNGAYAYYIHSNFTTFDNLSCDGAWYISSPGGKINNLTIEGITATASFPSSYAGQINQIGSAENITFNNVPNSKYNYGLSVIGDVADIGPMRLLGASQPNNAIQLYAGGSGTIRDIQATGMVNRIEYTLSDSILNGYVFTGCDDVTNRGLSYYQGTWTPNFSTWSTAPTVSSAKYIRTGKLVTIFLNFYDGVCADYSHISGLPFTADSGVGGSATMTSGDVAKKFTATITNGQSRIQHIPAQTLTGVYCQLTAQYMCA